MPDDLVRKIYDNADIVVSGYAFTIREDGFISILNVEHPECAMVVNHSGEIIETNMDEIEQSIVKDLCRRNLQFLEDAYA